MRKSEKSEKKVTTKSSSQEKSEKKVTTKSSSQSKKTDAKKSKDFDRKSGEVLGLKFINPNKVCDDDDDDDHSGAVPIKIPFANETRFSNGQAAYFYDILSPLFEKQFGKEAADVFKAFEDAPVKPVKEGETPEKQIDTPGKISETDLENGFHAYNWRPKDLDPEDYIF